MNNKMIIPYYNPEKLNLEMLEFDEPNLSYEYNILCFWATQDGRIYSASDSGCSWPTPFENYEGEIQKDVLQKLDRIGSVEDAESIFDNWNKDYDGRKLLPNSDKIKLSNWVKEQLKE